MAEINMYAIMNPLGKQKDLLHGLRTRKNQCCVVLDFYEEPLTPVVKNELLKWFQLWFQGLVVLKKKQKF